jgi:hypothetical protein
MLNQSRFNQLYASQTAVAKKVYDAVPKADCWTPAQIVGELARLGRRSDTRLVTGCLVALVDAGLVSQPERGLFRREPVREIVLTPKEPMTKETPSVPAAPALAPAKLEPMDRLGELSTRAGQLAELLRTLATDIADAAVDMQHQIEANVADLAKLKQLQALLKSLN